MSEDKINQMKEELTKMLQEKQEKDSFERRLTELQMKVHEADKEEQRKKQEIINEEARTLRQQGLGEGVAYIKCFKCKAEIPLAHPRETVKEGAGGWISLDAVCPACTEKVTYEHAENQRYAKVVTYCLLQGCGQGYGDFSKMLQGE